MYLREIIIAYQLLKKLKKPFSEINPFFVQTENCDNLILKVTLTVSPDYSEQ